MLCCHVFHTPSRLRNRLSDNCVELARLSSMVVDDQAEIFDAEVVELEDDDNEPVEPVFEMDKYEARGAVKRINERFEEIHVLVKHARGRRAWVASGYRSWDECCAREFDLKTLEELLSPALIAEIFMLES